jgi:competence protein ComEC
MSDIEPEVGPLRQGAEGNDRAGSPGALAGPRPAFGAMAFFAALAGWLAGSAVQLQQPELYSLSEYLIPLFAACALAAMLVAAYRRPGNGPVPVLLLAAALAAGLAAFAVTGLRSVVFLSGALDPELEGKDIELVGLVARLPQRSEAGLRFLFEPEGARQQGRAVVVPARIQLGWYGGLWAGPPEDVAAAGALELVRLPPELRVGERWQFTVRLKAPHGNLNPHGFDYELWLWEQGVQALGTVRQGGPLAAPRRIGSTWRHPVEQWRQQVRDAVFERVSDRRWAGIVAALVAGDQNAIERADWDVFRATGVAHLMSISGLHITMFAWASAWLVGWLWRRSPRLCLLLPAQHAALLCGLLLAALYALFSGWGVPAQRTVLMLASVILLRLSGKHWPWPFVWLLACTVVILADPWALLQPGFWLSFVAVAVLFASEGGDRAPPSGWRQRLLAGLREQWVVTLALAPLSLLLFQQLSLVGIFANLLAIPWVTLLVTPLALLGMLLAPLWDAAAWAGMALALGLEWLASLPFASVTGAAVPLWAGVAAVLGGVQLVTRLPLPLRLAGVCWMLPALLWQAPRPPAGEFELLAADVGQGNALLVRTASHTLVYDAGPRYSVESDAGQRVLVPLLRALDERVDMLLLSHRDTDHTGGARAVLQMQSQALLLSSLEPGHELAQARVSGPAPTRCLAAQDGGQAWEWDGVRFEVLHPRAGDYLGNAKPNTRSCVLRVSNPSRAALLAGDIEAAQEAALVQRFSAGDGAGTLQADLLLVPHHGSRTSSSAAFLQAVRPGLALAQAGYRNRFGHPAPVVAERYRELGIRLIDSAHCGAAWWRSQRPAQVDCERETARRYWHHRLPAPPAPP